MRGAPKSGWLLVVAAVVLVAGQAPVAAQDRPPALSPTTTAPTSSTTVVTSTSTSLPDDTTTTSVPVSGSTTTSTTTPGDPSPSSSTTTEPDDGDDGDAETNPDSPIHPSFDPEVLAELLRGYDEAVADQAALLAQFELSMAELNDLNATMVELSARISAVETDLLEAEVDLDAAEGRVDLAEIRLAGVEERLLAAQRLLEDQAVEAYIYGGRDPGLYALLGSESVNQAEASQQYAGAVTEHTDATVDVYAELQEEAEALRREAARAASDARRAHDKVERRRDELEVERQAQADAQADAFIAALAQQDLIHQVEAQRGTYEQRLRTLSGTSDSINGALRTSQEGQALPELTLGIFLPPLETVRVASPFGPRLHPIFGTVRMHNGLDLDAAAGTPIRAAEDGEVVVADWQNGYGFTVVIDHGNGLATLYAHQPSIIVAKGDQVEMGDVIGLVGSTGWSTGPHLHWEVRVFGNPTDPVPFLGGEELLAQRRAEEALEEDEAGDDPEGGSGRTTTTRPTRVTSSTSAHAGPARRPS